MTTRSPTHLGVDEDATAHQRTGWIVDPSVTIRLRWQLAHAPERVRAVIAPTGALRSGSSYRSHAERLGLQPLSACTEVRGSTLAGAAVVRAGHGVEQADDGIVVDADGGSVVIDHGTHAHDPGRPIASIEPATTWGRSPFPWRPTVVVAASDPTEDLASWARTMVNQLVELGLEARLAVPAIVPGDHLTRPCRLDATAIDRLRPEVVLALDDGAATIVDGRPGRSPKVLVLAADGPAIDLIDPVEQRTTARRGTFTRGAGSDELAADVRRLCLTRLALEPADEPVRVDVRPPRAPTHRRPAVRQSIAVVDATVEGRDRRRIDGLVDHLRRGGELVRVEAGPGSGPSSSAPDPDDLLIVVGATPDAELDERLRARRAAGRPSVLDLLPRDLAIDRDDPSGPAGLDPAAEHQARAAGNVTTSSPRLGPVLRRLGLRHLVLPTPFAAAAWPTAPDRHAPTPTGDAEVILWDVGSASAPAAVEIDDVAARLRELLDRRAGLAVDVVGAADRVPDHLLAHDRVRILATDAVGGRRPDWCLQVWSPHPVEIEWYGDGWPLVRAGRLGVPTLFTGTIASVLHPELETGLVALGPSSAAWIDDVGQLLDDPDQLRHLGAAAAARAWAARGTDTAARGVARLLRWAAAGADPSRADGDR